MSRRSRQRTFDNSVVGQYIRRGERLEALGFKNYQEFLRSELWRATRRRARKAGMTSCFICGSKERVQLHHNKYEIHAKPRLDNLVPLCDWCHGKVHEYAHEPGYHGTMRVAMRKHQRTVQNSNVLSAFLADDEPLTQLAQDRLQVASEGSL